MTTEEIAAIARSHLPKDYRLVVEPVQGQKVTIEHIPSQVVIICTTAEHGDGIGSVIGRACERLIEVLITNKIDHPRIPFLQGLPKDLTKQ